MFLEWKKSKKLVLTHVIGEKCGTGESTTVCTPRINDLHDFPYVCKIDDRQ